MYLGMHPKDGQDPGQPGQVLFCLGSMCLGPKDPPYALPWWSNELGRACYSIKDNWVECKHD